MNEANTPPKVNLLLRIFGGGYLIYLAWDVRDAVQTNPLFWIPIVIFAVVGVALAGHSVYTLATHKYFRKETESTEDREDEPNE